MVHIRLGWDLVFLVQFLLQAFGFVFSVEENLGLAYEAPEVIFRWAAVKELELSYNTVDGGDLAPPRGPKLL